MENNKTLSFYSRRIIGLVTNALRLENKWTHDNQIEIEIRD